MFFQFVFAVFSVFMEDFHDQCLTALLILIPLFSGCLHFFSDIRNMEYIEEMYEIINVNMTVQSVHSSQQDWLA